MSRRLRVSMVILVFLCLIAIPLVAAWNSGGNRVSTIDEDQKDHKMVADGEGKAILTWLDHRNGDWEIFAQKMDSAGSRLWGDTGVAVSNLSGGEEEQEMVSDDAGGAFVTWVSPTPTWISWSPDGVAVNDLNSDSFSPKAVPAINDSTIIVWVDTRDSGDLDLYAKKIDQDGDSVWTSDVGICAADGTQFIFSVAPDSLGGAFIVWSDERGSDADIYAQHVSSAGLVSWTADGEVVCSAAEDQGYPEAVADGLGGVIITWHDARGDGYHLDVYAQRLDASGSAMWTTDGVVINNQIDHQGYPRIVSRGMGASVITWMDARNGDYDNYDIYASGINSSGGIDWINSTCLNGSNQMYPVIGRTGNFTSIICWKDKRGGDWDIYAQKLNDAGNEFWGMWGTSVCSEAGDQENPALVDDGAGSAIFAWQDSRDGDADIYAQNLDSTDGSRLWQYGGVAVCVAPDSQLTPQICSTGGGGALIVWNSYDVGQDDFDVYAGAVDMLGYVLTPAAGTKISDGSGNQYATCIVPNGAGAGIIPFGDNRTGDQDIYAQKFDLTSPNDCDIYAQYLDTDGNRQWGDSGTLVCGYETNQSGPEIVYDGYGSVIVVWNDTRNDNADVYAQKIDVSTGAIQWDSDGIPVCADPADQVLPEAVSDMDGGAIVAWRDIRGPSIDIYAQRINEWGVVMWGSDVPVCNADGVQFLFDIESDLEGGAVLTWTDERAGDADIYAERINSLGVAKWALTPGDGYPVCVESEGQLYSDIFFDGDAAYISWQDRRDGLEDIYAQRVYDSTFVGVTFVLESWEENGIVVCGEPGVQVYPKISGYPDGNPPDCHDGIIVTWMDGRSGDYNDYDIYAQRISSSGDTMWAGEGELVCGEINNQLYPEIVFGDAAYIAWEDERDPWQQIYVQWFNYLGNNTLTGDGETPVASLLEQNYPNPFNPTTTIRFGMDSPGRVSLTIYDVAGRLVRRLLDEEMDAGYYEQAWDGIDERGNNVASGVYFYRIKVADFTETKKMVLLR